MNAGTNLGARWGSSLAVAQPWLIAVASMVILLGGSSAVAGGVDGPVQTHSPPLPFEGEKSSWHGYDRYDFFLDEQTLAIQPAPSKAGVVKGQRRCIVVVPQAAAPDNPWSWRGCYWDHEPQTEVELLRRGFHIAYITADASLRPDEKSCQPTTISLPSSNSCGPS